MRILLSNDNILLQMEEGELGWFLHCSMYNWSPKIYRETLIEVLDVMDELRDEGITTLYSASPEGKPAYFATMFGFNYTGISVEHEGTTYHIMEYDNGS